MRTPERIETIRRALMVGLDWNTAARCAGITDRVLRNWREEDPELSSALEEAKANAVVTVAAHLMKRIRDGDVGAMKFFLSMRSEEFRDRGNAVNVAVNQTTQIAAQVGPPAPNDGDLGEWIQKLGDVAKRQGLIGEGDGDGHRE